jgi:Uma2 family endonuclease
MATATSSLVAEADPIPIASGPADQSLRWFNLGWEGYLGLLEIRGGKRRPRIIYLDGDAHLVTTTSIHEQMVDRLGMFVRVIVEEFDIPCVTTRETTFNRQDQEAGVEPDDSFYLANYRIVAHKDGLEKIDLDVDPPPDLVLEIEYANPARQAVEILRRLAVPEVWVRSRVGLRFLVRNDQGDYLESTTSLNFPFLTPTEVFEWVDRRGMDSTTQWTRLVRQWVREVLAPRVQGQNR